MNHLKYACTAFFPVLAGTITAQLFIAQHYFWGSLAIMLFFWYLHRENQLYQLEWKHEKETILRHMEQMEVRAREGQGAIDQRD